MADRYPGPGGSGPGPVVRAERIGEGPTVSTGETTLNQKHQYRVTGYTQVAGYVMLVISSMILLMLTGLTLTGTVMGLIFLMPLILLSSPIWVPAGIVLFVVTAGFVLICSFGIIVVAGLSWASRYFRRVVLAGARLGGLSK